MDLEILKKKISTFRGEGGLLRSVSDDLLMEILFAWEQWSGPIRGFYTAIGVDRRKMASILGKAKKLKREGHFPIEEFKEIKIEGASSGASDGLCRIELTWEGKQVIRFALVVRSQRSDVSFRGVNPS